MSSLTLSAELFIHNRRRLQAKLRPGEAIIMRLPKLIGNISNHELDPYDDLDMYWLTGVNLPGSAVLITSNTEHIFYSEPTDLEKIWLSVFLTRNELVLRTGISDVHDLDDLDKLQHQLNITKLRRARSIVHGLRMVKSDLEIAAIQQAVDVTGQGLGKVRERLATAEFEYQLEASFTGGVMDAGAGIGFPPIVAAGSNATKMHYWQNNASLKPGQLIVFDCGAEMGRYTADVSRSFSTGDLNDRQKYLYEATIRVQEQSAKLIRPGITIRDYHVETAYLIGAELVQLGEISLDQSKDLNVIHKYFLHGVGHHLGLETHDVANYRRKLEPGMVVTCEPGIYLAEGLGVRIEDTLVVTEAGARNMSAGIPKGLL
jgi:Xaa-Pro aminopeptidase